jgi:hypothetical protein
MCLAINYCNSIILTAPGSTFAFWLAYLLPDEAPVFYNDEITKNDASSTYGKVKWPYDAFLQEWISIKVENSTARRTLKEWQNYVVQ